MAEKHEPVPVAVNVMRTRVTVVGFNIAIITFQLGNLRSFHAGGVELPSLQASVHLQADVTLIVGLALSVIALMAFASSAALDREGACTPSVLVAGDLLMYLGLSHTVGGFFAPFVLGLRIVAADFADQASTMTAVQLAVTFIGGLAWFLAMYAGPVVSIVRVSLGRRVKVAVALIYAACVLALCGLNLQATELQAARSEDTSMAPSNLLVELVQPTRW